MESGLVWAKFCYVHTKAFWIWRYWCICFELVVKDNMLIPIKIRFEVTGFQHFRPFSRIFCCNEKVKQRLRYFVNYLTLAILTHRTKRPKLKSMAGWYLVYAHTEGRLLTYNVIQPWSSLFTMYSLLRFKNEPLYRRLNCGDLGLSWNRTGDLGPVLFLHTI